ncbi:hypothetical protein GGR51DRAFT_522909 [Nemania sp. FL0031]|nr:hypothetical protein GGR51DRAFT_522909 [Nemania sp. FL0031]
MDEPSQEMFNLFKQLYSDGDYADLVITCHGKQHQVHKAIVCPRSDFFAAACRSNMKEARTGIIDLPDDDPYVVDMMVYYFYHLDYLVPVSNGARTSDRMGSRDADDDAVSSPPSYSDLVVHAKVYALAAKYFISSLKTLALRKFILATKKPWTPDDLIETAEEVYASTLESDRGLRDTVVKTLFENRKLLADESIQDILKRLNALTYDLLMYMNATLPRLPTDPFGLDRNRQMHSSLFGSWD